MATSLLLRAAALALLLLAGCAYEGGAPGTGGNDFDGSRAILPARLPNGDRILDFRFPLDGDGKLRRVQVRSAGEDPARSRWWESLGRRSFFGSFRVRDVRIRALTARASGGYIAGIVVFEAIFEDADGKIAFVLSERTGAKLVIFPGR